MFETKCLLKAFVRQAAGDEKIPVGSSLYNLYAKTSAYSNNLFDGFEPCFSV